MADQKITELTALTTPLKTHLLVIEEDPSGTPTTKSITLENLLKVINDLTAEASPVVGSDYVVIYSASAGAPRKVLLDDLGVGGGGGDGWTSVSVSWTYASASTITVPSGAASIYKTGMGIRLKQGGGYKYYYIVTVADTLLTVTGGSDYTIANSAITDIAYTLTPAMAIGFPQEFNFNPNFTNITTGNGTLVAKFSFVGAKIQAHIMLEFGSTTSVSGAVSFTLPVSISSYTVPSSSRSVIGTLGILDSGTTVFLGSVILGGSSSSAQFRAQNNSGSGYAQIAALSSTVPMTWTTGDSIGAEFVYAP